MSDMTDNRTTELLYAINADSIQAFCPFDSEAMSDYCCPACGSNGIVLTNDFERDLTILRCRACGEMFAVSNMDAYDNGENWVFSEWANSLAC